MSKGWYAIDRQFHMETCHAVGPVAWSVLTTLMMHDDGTRTCWPSRNTIMAESGIRSKTTFAIAVRKLEDAGVLHREHRNGGACLYHLRTGSKYEPVSVQPVQIMDPNKNKRTRNKNKRSRNRARTQIAQHHFDTFYLAYPRKRDRGRAEKAYHAAIKVLTDTRGASPDEAAVIIQRAVDRYASERDGEDPKYTKHPATWLNAQAYLDEPDPEPVDPEKSALDDLVRTATAETDRMRKEMALR